MAQKEKTCPKCATKVSRWDTVCIECGSPLVADEQIDYDTAVTAGIVVGQTVVGAAAGMAEPGENSEKTRLRVFDKHLAQQLSKERPAIVVLTIISLGLALALTHVAAGLFRKLPGGLLSYKEFELNALISQRFGMMVDPQVLFVVAAGLALAGYLCTAGEAVRFVAASRAIAAVKAGQIPDVVGVTVLTRFGLMLAAALLPPVGLILGIILKLSQSNELRELGGKMIYLASAVIALVLLGVVWDVMAEFAQSRKPLTTATP